MGGWFERIEEFKYGIEDARENNGHTGVNGLILFFAQTMGERSGELVGG